MNKIPKWQIYFQEKMDSQNPPNLTDEQKRVGAERAERIMARAQERVDKEKLAKAN